MQAHRRFNVHTIIWMTVVILTLTLGAGCQDSSTMNDPDDVAPSVTGDKPSQLPPGVSVDDFGQNNHNISRDQWEVNPGFISEGILRVGDGLDVSDPGAPERRAGNSPLKLDEGRLQAIPVESYTVDESFTFKEASSTREEAEILSAYFQGSYKFVSAEAALDRAAQERKTSRSIYAVLDAKGQVEDISEELGGRTLTWRDDVKPRFEGQQVTPDEFRRQFLLDFGSHYVSAITYGYRIAIRGKMTGLDTKKETDVRAAFNVAFIGGGAGGKISNETRKTLSQSGVDLAFAATSGGLYREGEQRPATLTSLDDILVMLQDIKEGKLTIHGAPISAVARTYWNLLPTDFRYSRALLADHGSPPPPEPFYGVPSGTIIPWYPGPEAIRIDNAGNQHLLPPEGWALCNGEGRTPDLRERFVMGTTDLERIGKSGGTGAHKHDLDVNVQTKDVAAIKGLVKAKTKAVKSVGISVKKSGDHTHPHVRLVYIMRL